MIHGIACEVNMSFVASLNPEELRKVPRFCHVPRKLVLPSLKWATDNGAMIALAAFDYLDAGIDPGTQPISRIPLTEW